MTVPSDIECDPQAHISLGDIALDDHRHTLLMHVAIIQSKTDPFCKGINIFIGCTGTDLYTVVTLLDYLNEVPRDRCLHLRMDVPSPDSTSPIVCETPSKRQKWIKPIIANIAFALAPPPQRQQKVWRTV